MVTATSTGHNNSTIITGQDTDKLSITTECFNCHGFVESVGYILSRVPDLNFMFLSETWFKFSEPDLIQNTQSACDIKEQ